MDWKVSIRNAISYVNRVAISTAVITGHGCDVYNAHLDDLQFITTK